MTTAAMPLTIIAPPYRSIGLDRRAPAGILSIIAFYHFSVYLLQSGGYLADFAVGYLAAVYLSDRRNMGGGAGQEALCGAVKLHPIDMPFDCFNAQLGFS